MSSRNGYRVPGLEQFRGPQPQVPAPDDITEAALSSREVPANVTRKEPIPLPPKTVSSYLSKKPARTGPKRRPPPLILVPRTPPTSEDEAGLESKPDVAPLRDERDDRGSALIVNPYALRNGALISTEGSSERLMDESSHSSYASQQAVSYSAFNTQPPQLLTQAVYSRQPQLGQASTSTQGFTASFSNLDASAAIPRSAACHASSAGFDFQNEAQHPNHQVYSFHPPANYGSTMAPSSQASNYQTGTSFYGHRDPAAIMSSSAYASQVTGQGARAANYEHIPLPLANPLQNGSDTVTQHTGWSARGPRASAPHESTSFVSPSAEQQRAKVPAYSTQAAIPKANTSAPTSRAFAQNSSTTASRSNTASKNGSTESRSSSSHATLGLRGIHYPSPPDSTENFSYAPAAKGFEAFQNVNEPEDDYMSLARQRFIRSDSDSIEWSADNIPDTQSDDCVSIDQVLAAIEASQAQQASEKSSRKSRDAAARKSKKEALKLIPCASLTFSAYAKRAALSKATEPDPRVESSTTKSRAKKARNSDKYIDVKFAKFEAEMAKAYALGQKLVADKVSAVVDGKLDPILAGRIVGFARPEDIVVEEDLTWFQSLKQQYKQRQIDRKKAAIQTQSEKQAAYEEKCRMWAKRLAVLRKAEDERTRWYNGEHHHKEEFILDEEEQAAFTRYLANHRERILKITPPVIKYEHRAWWRWLLIWWPWFKETEHRAKNFYDHGTVTLMANMQNPADNPEAHEVLESMSRKERALNMPKNARHIFVHDYYYLITFFLCMAWLFLGTGVFVSQLPKSDGSCLTPFICSTAAEMAAIKDALLDANPLPSNGTAVLTIDHFSTDDLQLVTSKLYVPLPVFTLHDDESSLGPNVGSKISIDLTGEYTTTIRRSSTNQGHGTFATTRGTASATEVLSTSYSPISAIGAQPFITLAPSSTTLVISTSTSGSPSSSVTELSKHKFPTAHPFHLSKPRPGLGFIDHGFTVHNGPVMASSTSSAHVENTTPITNIKGYISHNYEALKDLMARADELIPGFMGHEYHSSTTTTLEPIPGFIGHEYPSSTTTSLSPVPGFIGHEYPTTTTTSLPPIPGFDGHEETPTSSFSLPGFVGHQVSSDITSSVDLPSAVFVPSTDRTSHFAILNTFGPKSVVTSDEYLTTVIVTVFATTPTAHTSSTSIVAPFITHTSSGTTTISKTILVTSILTKTVNKVTTLITLTTTVPQILSSSTQELSTSTKSPKTSVSALCFDTTLAHATPIPCPGSGPDFAPPSSSSGCSKAALLPHLGACVICSIAIGVLVAIIVLSYFGIHGSSPPAPTSTVHF